MDEDDYVSDAESDASIDDIDVDETAKKPKIKIYDDDEFDNESKQSSDDDDADEADDDEHIVIDGDERLDSSKMAILSDIDDSDDDDDDDNDDEDENYLQKFEKSVRTNIISTYHPEKMSHNNDEIDIMSRVVRDESGFIIDPLHRTLPFITKFEKARVIGERARQLNSGAISTIPEDPLVIDGYLIALEEFKYKKIPFIIRRPLPNGGSEYWKVKDLEQ